MARLDDPAEVATADPVAGRRYSAFGLELLSSLRIPQLFDIGEHGNGRPTVIRELPSEEARRWRYPQGDVLFDRRLPDGRLMLGVDHNDGVGYRIWSTGYGRFVVSDDALEIRAAVSRTPPSKWQRLFFAQVLPLAAALRGALLIHASAVAVDGFVYAFAAPSGTGKTSTALHLLGRGATLVTDDVLAVTGTDAPLAHPGASVVAVNSEDIAGLNRDEGALVGPVDPAIDGKAQVRIPLVTQPLPLAAVYFMERGEGTRSFVIEEIAPDPRVLLSNVFIAYLRTPAYLTAMLDGSALLSRDVRLFRVRVPATFGAAATSRELAEHIRGLKAARAA